MLDMHNFMDIYVKKIISKLSLLASAKLVLLMMIGSVASAQDGQRPLDVLTWGGAYQQSQEKAYFEPFLKAQSIQINPRTHLVEDGQTIVNKLAEDDNWDIADLTSKDELEACKKGLLREIKIEEVLSEAEAGADDFLPGAIHKCGIGSVAWSSVIISNRRKFRKRQPKTVKDLFNIKRFPGKRALPKGPKYLLEMALMADGVPASEVYALLDTVDGEDRAFEKLEKLRGQVIWWEQATDPLKILTDGQAVMAMAYSGRAFNEITSQRHPFDIIWDGQIYDIEYWTISKKTDAADAALKFVSFALGAERMAEQARWFPYGPMRKSAVAAVGNHALLNIDMKQFIPTTPDHMRKALQLNTDWWNANEKRLNTRFEAWLKDSDEEIKKVEAQNGGSR